ncbi:spermatogenesis associated, serine-rich 2, partial [Columba livia]
EQPLSPRTRRSLAGPSAAFDGSGPAGSAVQTPGSAVSRPVWELQPPARCSGARTLFPSPRTAAANTMSKKQNTKDPSGFVFDVQSNTVMAQGGAFENMKEKISAVRAIVPNRSNNEIVLVLQHFDNCVDRTVQAFMEGNASEVLKEWTVTGKKKNKKKKSKAKARAPSSGSDATKSAPAEEERPARPERAGINGFHVNPTTPSPPTRSARAWTRSPSTPGSWRTATCPREQRCLT